MNRSTYDKLVSNIDTLRAEFRDPENVDEEAVRALVEQLTTALAAARPQEEVNDEHDDDDYMRARELGLPY